MASGGVPGFDPGARRNLVSVSLRSQLEPIGIQQAA